MIVEFAGTPGVGKSYIADRLLAALRAEGHDAHDGLDRVAATLPGRARALRKSRIAAIEVVRSPVDAVRIVRAVISSRQPPIDLVKLVHNWLVVRGTMRAARRFGGIQLFDQGIIQHLCSVGFRGDWQLCLKAAAPGRQHLGPDVIVRVTAPTTLNATRLTTRPSHHSRVEDLADDQRLAELVRQDQVLTEIEDRWSEMAALPRLRRLSVPNDGELTTEALALLISRLV